MRIGLLFLLITIASCSSIRNYTLMKKGAVRQTEFTETIPFKYNGNHIIIKVKIKGEDYNFLLDSGAPNVISVELATKLKLNPGFSAGANDAGGNSSNLEFVTLEELQIGNIDFINTGAAIADINKNDFIYCMGIDGLIGANLMKEAIWEIDCTQQKITISNSINSIHIPPTANVIPFKRNFSGSPIVDVDCNGEQVNGVVIDLGSNGGIKIPMNVFNQMKDKNFPIALGYGSNAAGLYGNFEPDTTRKVLLPKLTLGESVLKNQLTTFDKQSDRIGMAFLRDYTIILNWFNNEMILVGNQQEQKSVFNTFGFKYNRHEDKLQVSFVFQNSSAEEMGLKIGDIILKINDVDCGNVSFDKFCELLNLDFLNTVDHIDIKIQREEHIIQLSLSKENLLN